MTKAVGSNIGRGSSTPVVSNANIQHALTIHTESHWSYYQAGVDQGRTLPATNVAVRPYTAPTC